METSTKNAALPALVLGLCLVLAAALGAHAFTKAKALGNTLAVTGSADKIVDSDTVKWTVRVSRTVPPGGQAAVGQRLNADRAEVEKLLASIGVGEDSVSIQPMSIYPNTEYDQQSGHSYVTGYTADQVLVFESSKVSEVGTLAQNATGTMAARDITLATQGLEYFYGKLADVKLELLTSATKNARDRAEAIVSGGGGGLGEVRSADTGVFQVTSVNSADLSDYGSYDTSSPKKKVTAVVHATFGLK